MTKRALKPLTKVSKLRQELKFLKAAFGYGANNDDENKRLYDSLARSVALIDEIYADVKHLTRKIEP